jgi:hypothetical protein
VSDRYEQVLYFTHKIIGLMLKCIPPHALNIPLLPVNYLIEVCNRQMEVYVLVQGSVNVWKATLDVPDSL